jgi:hypothetical protein
MMERNESTWSVVAQLGLTIKNPKPGQLVVYGSADPLPNPAEIMLTHLVASRYDLKWRFFVYRHGRNLPMSVDEKLLQSLPPQVFYLEDVIPKDLTLGEMAQEIFRLREECVIVAHLADGGLLRATSRPKEKWKTKWVSATIAELHEAGGWLGGSAIYYLLRLLAEERNEILYLCPFQSKGRVYRVFQGLRRPLFLLAPFVRFVPPGYLGLPSWAPAPVDYWLSLKPKTRMCIRKEVEKRVLSDELRIEIPLP